MTRQDYELIAKVLKAGRSLWGKEPIAAHTLDYITGCFANKLAEENPKFNRDRFMKAAGGKTS